MLALSHPVTASPAYLPPSPTSWPRHSSRHHFRSLHRTPLRLPRKRPHLRLSPPPFACLNPPNSQADWVVVDVTLTGLSEAPTPTFVAEVEDDAKSLVRTLLRDKSAELSVALASDDGIRGVNCEWRGVDDATDVLAFPQNDPDGVVLGDVMISLETAERQMREKGGEELRDEVRVLLVHGVLHLLGYDHVGKIEGDWLVMAQMENKMMKALGWKGEGLVAAVQDPFYKEIIQA